MTRRKCCSWFWPAAGTLLLAATCLAAEPAIRLDQAGESGMPSRFVVSGLPRALASHLEKHPPAEAEWQKLLAVHVVTDGKPSAFAMLGDFAPCDEGFCFTPRYPLRPGMTYRAVFDPAGLGLAETSTLARVTAEFRLPARPPGPPTRLTRIFPTGHVMPENLLKFYLHFSAPMRRGEAYQRIRLVDDNGQQVEEPFLELTEELWSPDGCRFTLYFDPGRIKRGLKPREEFGPALVEGRSYSLIIDRGWPDAADQALAESVTKRFRVVAPDDTQPNPKRWKITAPRADTRQALTVDFDEPLDGAMLQRVLDVLGPQRQLLPGKVSTSDEERRWHFLPDGPWEAGNYGLVVATALEDLAGNSIGRPFEVDVLRPARQSQEDETVELRFVVQP